MAKKHKPVSNPVSNILVLSDLHIGSAMAPIPDGFITANGNLIQPNALQQWLNACWEDMQQWVTTKLGDKPYALVLNGDIIDGLHHGAKEAFSPEIDDQIEAATMLLTPLSRRAAKTYVVTGTECHTQGYEHRIAFELGAEKNPETKRCAWQRLMLSHGANNVLFKHHIGTSMRMWTEASAYAAQLAEERVQAAMNGHPIPSMLVCAHRHKFGHWEDAYGGCCVTPPWQCATRYAHKVVPNPVVRPGAVLLDLSGNRVKVDHITYDAPLPKRVLL